MSSLNLCQGCLSSDRRLKPVGKHKKLYQQLLLTKPNIPAKKLLFCWECQKNLQNIYKFRLKITEAQCQLSSKLFKYKSLSSLTVVTKVDEYETIFKTEEQLLAEIGIEIKEETDFWEDADDKLEINNVDENETDNVKTHRNEFYSIVKEEVKYEDNADIYFDEKHLNDIEMLDDKDVKEDFEQALVHTNLIVNNPVSAIARLSKIDDDPVKKTRKKPVLKRKYRTIIMKNLKKRKLYDKLKINDTTMKEWMEKKRKQLSNRKFQCQLCYCGFAQQKFYDRHIALKHAESLGRFKCDICKFRFRTRHNLKTHLCAHYVQFVCKLCSETFWTLGEMHIHLTHGPHGRMKECVECGLRFDCRQRKDYYEHYRIMHEQFFCDYCGKRFLKKDSLVHHIGIHHTDPRCKICNFTFSDQNSLLRHNNRIHVDEETEENFCVECNVQFKNSIKYKEHLKTSVKHRANPAIPCPDCGKVYTKKINMTNHYALVHLKKTRYFCALCDTYFLNGFRLRYHQKYFHEKRPKPRHKICNYCGKGFSNNRILDNHMRTHTGERPFACEQCSAAFTQKQALSKHVTTAHRN